ncbi:MAG: hypothetical protein LBR10_04040 [Prevotellaceae bacterium]|jgi:hypothetical protein|nr:hypothetical protein [Prevotellaceae bacterium]
MQKKFNITPPPVQTILRVGERLFLGKNENKDKRIAFSVKAPVNETFTVDWGDDTIHEYKGSNSRILLYHDYASKKEFIVTIKGIITLFNSNVFDPTGEDVGFGVDTCDVRDNPYIEALSCSGDLLLRNNYSLRELPRFAVGINNIDISQLPALECIGFMDSFYNGPLDMSHNPKLKYLSCPCNNITELNVSGCPDLEYLDICYNTCELDLRHNHRIKYVFANGIDKEKIHLPEGRTVISDHEVKVSDEKYWTLLG